MNEEELLRRQEYIIFLRRLRDASDPFNLPNEVFRRLYRFPRELAQDIFLELAPLLGDGVRNTKIPKVLRFLVALHFYSQGGYQKSVGTDNLCTMTQPAVSRCIKEVTDCIVNNFSGRLIKFPVTLNEVTVTKNGFFDKYNFPGIIGTVDGTHISIVAPVMGGIPPRAIYLNRKNYYSINCQIICNSNLKILAICAKYPGSVHDSAIWMMSNIFRDLKNRYRQGDRTSWLIGDSGYPLQPFLLTPVLNAEQGTPQSRYNESFYKARNVVERCIGVLKGTFRCLLKERTLHYKPKTAARIAIACATLHNILRDRNVDMHDYENDSDDEQEIIDDNEEQLYHAGIQTRNNVIANHFV